MQGNSKITSQQSAHERHGNYQENVQTRAQAKVRQNMYNLKQPTNKHNQ